MSMFNLLEHSDNYSETSGSLWQCYRDKAVLSDVGALDNFPANSASFKFKQKVTGKTENNGTKILGVRILLYLMLL